MKPKTRPDAPPISSQYAYMHQRCRRMPHPTTEDTIKNQSPHRYLEVRHENASAPVIRLSIP